MIPFSDYVVNGETIYLAVHVKYAERLTDIAKMLPSSLDALSDFRLLFTLFSDRLELVYLCDQSTVDVLMNWIVDGPQDWHDGASLDPVIGMALADHAAVRRREQPTLFVFSDGAVESHWDRRTLSQLLRVVWLHEPLHEPAALITPFGTRREAGLECEVSQDADQQPEEQRKADD
jgi:hypothetical protein